MQIYAICAENFSLRFQLKSTIFIWISDRKWCSRLLSVSIDWMSAIFSFHFCDTFSRALSILIDEIESKICSHVVKICRQWVKEKRQRERKTKVVQANCLFWTLTTFHQFSSLYNESSRMNKNEEINQFMNRISAGLGLLFMDSFKHPHPP
jgi:hypothetical protein